MDGSTDSQIGAASPASDAPVPLALVTQVEEKPAPANRNRTDPTPLSLFVRERLHELGLKQADFCRLHTFDQGMLSRIQNSMVFNLNLESVLRLAVGLQVSPRIILDLIGRPELHDLMQAAYAQEWASSAAFSPEMSFPHCP